MPSPIRSFDKAPLDKSTGSQQLKGGVTYFIDTNENKLLDSDEILKLIKLIGGEDNITSILHSLRGQIMVEFNPENDVVIPNNILQKTGYFYILCSDNHCAESLQDAQEVLYGDRYNEAVGFFEYIESKKPVLYKAINEGWKSLKNTLPKIGIAYGVGAVVILGILILLRKR